MFQVQQKGRLTALGIALALMCGGAVTARADDGKKSGLIIDINNPKRSLYPIAIPRGLGSSSAARRIQKIASFDMKVAGWFKVLDPTSFLANLKQEGLGIVKDKWSAVGAFGVMKYKVSQSGRGVNIQFRLYEVGKGNSPVLSRKYRGSTRNLRQLVHKWCNEVVFYFTHEKGFFGSKIAFVTRRSRGSKRVIAMDFDGARAYSLTRNRSLNILPAWSPGGGKMAFTSYMRMNPDLYVVGAGGGRPRRLSKRRGMNTGADWSPDGSKIALTLSKDGNPEIYVISASTGAILRRLTKNRAIDTSPAWSPDGREIAFVSDREGGPQIFVMNADGSNQRRVSFNGPYNTTPAWNPRKGTRQLAYTLKDGGASDIMTLDLTTKNMVRITQNEGTNEEPAWAPNGRAIAFASVRSGGSGVYIANSDGTGKAVKVWGGYATSVDWGPAP